MNWGQRKGPESGTGKGTASGGKADAAETSADILRRRLKIDHSAEPIPGKVVEPTGDRNTRLREAMEAQRQCDGMLSLFPGAIAGVERPDEYRSWIQRYLNDTKWSAAAKKLFTQRLIVELDIYFKMNAGFDRRIDVEARTRATDLTVVPALPQRYLDAMGLILQELRDGSIRPTAEAKVVDDGTAA